MNDFASAGINLIVLFTDLAHKQIKGMGLREIRDEEVLRQSRKKSYARCDFIHKEYDLNANTYKKKKKWYSCLIKVLKG